MGKRERERGSDNEQVSQAAKGVAREGFASLFSWQKSARQSIAEKREATETAIKEENYAKAQKKNLCQQWETGKKKNRK